MSTGNFDTCVLHCFTRVPYQVCFPSVSSVSYKGVLQECEDKSIVPRLFYILRVSKSVIYIISVLQELVRRVSEHQTPDANTRMSYQDIPRVSYKSVAPRVSCQKSISQERHPDRNCVYYKSVLQECDSKSVMIVLPVCQCVTLNVLEESQIRIVLRRAPYQECPTRVSWMIVIQRMPCENVTLRLSRQASQTKGAIPRLSHPSVTPRESYQDCLTRASY